MYPQRMEKLSYRLRGMENFWAPWAPMSMFPNSPPLSNTNPGWHYQACSSFSACSAWPWGVSTSASTKDSGPISKLWQRVKPDIAGWSSYCPIQWSSMLVARSFMPTRQCWINSAMAAWTTSSGLLRGTLFTRANAIKFGTAECHEQMPVRKTHRRNSGLSAQTDRNFTVNRPRPPSCGTVRTRQSSGSSTCQTAKKSRRPCVTVKPDISLCSTSCPTVCGSIATGTSSMQTRLKQKSSARLPPRR